MSPEYMGSQMSEYSWGVFMVAILAPSSLQVLAAGKYLTLVPIS